VIELPEMSSFDQVHQASGFGAFELSQNTVFRQLEIGNIIGECVNVSSFTLVF
jgi:hypothetical protein